MNSGGFANRELTGKFLPVHHCSGIFLFVIPIAMEILFQRWWRKNFQQAFVNQEQAQKEPGNDDTAEGDRFINVFSRLL